MNEQKNDAKLPRMQRVQSLSMMAVILTQTHDQLLNTPQMTFSSTLLLFLNIKMYFIGIPMALVSWFMLFAKVFSSLYFA